MSNPWINFLAERGGGASACSLVWKNMTPAEKAAYARPSKRGSSKKSSSKKSSPAKKKAPEVVSILLRTMEDKYSIDVPVDCTVAQCIQIATTKVIGEKPNQFISFLVSNGKTLDNDKIISELEPNPHEGMITLFVIYAHRRF